MRGLLRWIAIAASLGFVAAAVPSAGGLTLMTIQGRVTDPVGRPIANALVTDGNQIVVTAEDGSYRIEEEDLNTYRVTASKSGLDSATKVVGPVEAAFPVDFALTYLITPSVSPSAFNNSPPKTLTVTAKSHAPPDSCVEWVDVSTGTVVMLTIESAVPGGESTWSGQFSVPAGIDDSRYSHRAVASDCTSAVALTRVVARSYIVDSVPVDLNALLPQDGGNTIFVDQPLLAKVSDELSGVDPASIEFRLHDETAASSTTYSQDSVGWMPSTGWARTIGTTLVGGHYYRISLSVADFAGNVLQVSQMPISEGGGFYVTQFEALPSVATIPRTPCTVESDIDPITQTKRAVCDATPLHLAATSVTFDGVRTEGFGVVIQRVNLSSARLRTTVLGLPREQTAYEEGTTREVPMRYRIENPSASEQIAEVPQVNAELGRLETRVPAYWDSASIDMSAVSTVVRGVNCPDPVGSSNCVGPDPLTLRSRSPWLPSITAPHIGPCDASGSHRESVAVTPVVDLRLAVSIDSEEFVPTGMTLHYRLNEGAPQSVPASSSGNVFEAVVPGGDIAEGSVIDYAFEAEGSGVGERCQDVSTLVIPSNASFRSLATADATQSNEELHRAALVALEASVLQPGVPLDESVTERCSAFFVPPTPCDIFPTGTETDEPEQTGSEGYVAIGGESAGGGASAMALQGGDCVYTNNWVGKLDYSSTDTGIGDEGAAFHVLYPQNGVWNQYAYMSKENWPGDAAAERRSRGGLIFGVRWNDGRSDPMDVWVRITYTVEGQAAAAADSSEHSLGIAYFACPGCPGSGSGKLTLGKQHVYLGNSTSVPTYDGGYPTDQVSRSASTTAYVFPTSSRSTISRTTKVADFGWLRLQPSGYYYFSLAARTRATASVDTCCSYGAGIGDVSPWFDYRNQRDIYARLPGPSGSHGWNINLEEFRASTPGGFGSC